jgi:ribosomal-protein-serine acetyltransferase
VNTFQRPINAHAELRLLQEADADILFALTEANRAYLRKWLPWVDGTRTVEDSLRFIRESLRQLHHNNGFQTGIWQNGKLAGVVGYNYINHERQQTELGYWLGEAYQGNGLMTDACRVLIDYAFETLKLKRVEIRCAFGNTKSCAIPKRLGFAYEGVIGQLEWLYDRYIDVHVYRMLVENWPVPKE